ncbi:hypothetical protein CEN45_02685 [Fischerella thermalis CCMEE 5198]|uniref:GUN4 domain-containing protein n=1 Tax=Fischerella thermalis TaxID=372787 RepID=UPI000C80441D|nr:GUN4 domain-containing protein [Fischerella thermalis]PMB01494.1 hypothetical protein CI594_09265 [Fischerella thermalis CCMEE 5196]PMB26861.1 hypothetical protein CEN45_02685 [Fischerella thermalis CCMEE 5198]
MAKKEHIKEFPCQDLRTIDALWTKYSQGHFGFSMQKHIWLELGAEIDKYTECLLGDRVGWRIKQEWLKYSDLNFSLNAPQGHLPSRLVGVSPSLGMEVLIFPKGDWGLVSLCSPLVENSPNGWVWFWGDCLFYPGFTLVNYEVSHHKYGQGN